MKRLAFIDSLRGLAAVYVVLFHAVFLASPVLESPSWAGLIIMNGGTGVTLFFLVSAFSLCHAHRNGFSNQGAKLDFYLRRAFRILPLFYAMLTVVLIRDRWFSPWPHTATQIAMNVIPVYNLFPKESGGIVPASWTIGTEVVFYAVFPFVFARLRTLPGILAAILAALMVGVAFHEYLVECNYAPATIDTAYLNSFAKHLPTFLLGMAVWMVYERHIKNTKWPESYGWILILGSLWVFHAYMYGAMAVLFPDTYYWQALVYAGLLLGLAVVPARLFVNQVWLYCGRISYSIYLSHPLIIFALRPLLARIESWHASVSLRFIACEALVLVVVIPAASLAFLLIERPGMRLGHRVTAYLRRKIDVSDMRSTDIKLKPSTVE